MTVPHLCHNEQYRATVARDIRHTLLDREDQRRSLVETAGLYLARVNKRKQYLIVVFELHLPDDL